MLSCKSDKHSSYWHPPFPCSSSSLLSLRVRMSLSSYWSLFALSSVSWLWLIYLLPLNDLWCSYYSSMMLKCFWVAVIFPYLPLSPVASDESALKPVLFWGSSNTIIGLWVTYCEDFGCYEFQLYSSLHGLISACLSNMVHCSPVTTSLLNPILTAEWGSLGLT